MVLSVICHIHLTCMAFSLLYGYAVLIRYPTAVYIFICATISVQVVRFELFSTEVQIFAILLC